MYQVSALPAVTGQLARVSRLHLPDGRDPCVVQLQLPFSSAFYLHILRPELVTDAPMMTSHFVRNIIPLSASRQNAERNQGY